MPCHPAPLKTRAALGIDHLDEPIDKAYERAPARRLVTIQDVGAMAALSVLEIG
jgi:enoyl-[acyl-carrier protein] reductase I